MTDGMGCFIGNGAAKCLRPKPGDEADSPRYILHRVGRRLPDAEGGVAMTGAALRSGA